MNRPVQLYGVPFSNFVRSAALVCEEKGIEYTVSQSVNGRHIERYSPEHHNLHPFAKMPVLIDGDLTLAETATIVRYLDRAFGPERLQGRTPHERARVDQWCGLIGRYIDEVLIRHFMLELAMPTGSDGRPDGHKLEAGRERAANAVALLADQLGDKPFLVTRDFSLADAMLAPMLAYNAELDGPLNLIARHGNLADYTQRLMARDSGRAVLKPLAESLPNRETTQA